MKTTSRPFDSLGASASNARTPEPFNLRPHGRPWKLVRALLCFAVILSCAPAPAFAWPAAAAPPAAAPAQGCAPVPTDEEVKQFNEALGEANAALTKLGAANKPLEDAAKAIKEGLKKIALDTATVTQFENVAKLLKEGVSTEEGQLTAVSKEIVATEQKEQALNNRYRPFKVCVGDANAPDKVKLVITAYETFGKAFTAQKNVKRSLAEALKGLPASVTKFVGLMEKGASAANALRPVLDPQTLRTELAKTIPDLAKAMTARRLFDPVVKNLADALDPSKFRDIKELEVSKPDFDKLFAKTDKTLNEVLGKLPDWAEQAANAANEQQKEAQTTLAEVSRDPFHNAAALLALSTTAERARKDFESLSQALQTLLAEVQNKETPEGVLPKDFVPDQAKALSDFTETLKRVTARLAGTLELLRAEVPVDKSTWTMASVNLFYFDNVERLMRVLSPNTRLVSSLNTQDFQGDARRARETLLRESQELEEAESAVSDRRAEVGKLQERIRVAAARKSAAVRTQRIENATQRSAVEKAEARERATAQRRKNLEAQQALAQRRFDRAQAAADADADDEDAADDVEIQRRLDNAARDLDRAKLLTDEARAEEERAAEEAEAARGAAGVTTDIDEDVDALKTELTTAQGELTSALTRRSQATTNHRTALREAFLAAQTENFAFAQARDNAPFLTNLPAPTPTPTPSASPTPTPAPRVVIPDSDPLNRVVLFAYPDTRTIFIRGARADIDLVRQIISEFDRPQGQAVMTLRTMEINSDGTRDGARRALKFLKEMDGKLVAAQSNVEAALSFLRDKLNEQVAAAAAAQKKKLEAEIRGIEGDIATLQTKVGRLTDDAQKRALWYEITAKGITRDLLSDSLTRQDELETVGFYGTEMMEKLGWRKDLASSVVNTRFLNVVVPPPSKTVNLAQALIVIALATKENRQGIVQKLTSKDKPDPFVSLRRFLGPEGDAADIVGFQARLVAALRFNAIPHVLEVAESRVRLRMQLLDDARNLSPALFDATQKIERLQDERASLNVQIPELNRVVTSPPAGTSAEDVEVMSARLAALTARAGKVRAELRQAEESLIEARGDLSPAERGHLSDITDSRTRLDDDIPVVLDWLQGNTAGVSTGVLRARIEKAIASTDSTSALAAEAAGLRRSARSRFSQASESAVNLTFRRYLEQVNRDLTEVYVKPTFREINDLLLEKKLGVGVLQETSILASNRLVARVDPRGSAQLAVGEEKDVLEAARQLTNLFGIAGKSLATGKTGNPLALAGGPLGAAATVVQSAQEVFGALDQLPRDAQPAVYGISTGNLFQVTPVIDPSGQALRFRFDLVSATQVREPDDTIDPILPRIERHSVNTEVHLGDQEIRLISQFQANSRVGVPTRKSGGIPIIKDIPGVHKVPLIGWFVRRGGHNSQTQQSFIFCQTAMYPTLSEVLDAVVQSPTFTGLD